MVVFDKIEGKEYKNLLHLFKEEEKGKKSKEMLSALDLYRMNAKRRILMHNITKPLMLKFQDEFKISDIYFSTSSDDNITLNIDYTKDDKDGFMVLENPNFDEYVDVLLDSSNGKYQKIIDKNKKMIIDILQQGLDNNFNENLRMKSTSEIFTLNINVFKYLLESHNSKNELLVRILYEFYQRNSIQKFTNYSVYQNINDMLQNSEFLHQYLEHIKFYSDDVPKYLIKKR